jgi:hypothetical protein
MPDDTQGSDNRGAGDSTPMPVPWCASEDNLMQFIAMRGNTKPHLAELVVRDSSAKTEIS